LPFRLHFSTAGPFDFHLHFLRRFFRRDLSPPERI
jgi:hypothetical protein